MNQQRGGTIRDTGAASTVHNPRRIQCEIDRREQFIVDFQS